MVNNTIKENNKVKEPKVSAKTQKQIQDFNKRKASVLEKKVSLRDRLKANLSKRANASRSAFDDIKRKLKNLKPKKKPVKLSKKAQQEQKKLNRQQQMRGILGIGLLFVVVSITYSTYVIYNGVSSSASRVMLVPQVVFALLILFKAFSKIYK